MIQTSRECFAIYGRPDEMIERAGRHIADCASAILVYLIDPPTVEIGRQVNFKQSVRYVGYQVRPDVAAGILSAESADSLGLRPYARGTTDDAAVFLNYGSDKPLSSINAVGGRMPDKPVYPLTGRRTGEPLPFPQ